LNSFSELKDAFSKTGFEEDEVKTLYQMLAAILHLGAVEFDDSQFNESSW
jgi:myosin heavy subunit